MLHLTRYSILSKSVVSVKEKDLEVEMDCILKASASLLSSGQGHKWGVRNALETKHHSSIHTFQVVHAVLPNTGFSLMYREE